MRLVELLIDEEMEDFGVEAISLVKFPAIEENMVFFKHDDRFMLAKVDEDKRMLVGPALIPDKNIGRYDKEKDEEYEVYFSKETVKKASLLFMQQKRNADFTIDHERAIEGLSVFESWIVDDPKMDKSNLYGFEMREGTWMVSVKVDNDAVWKAIREKDVRGFSIEGYFVDRLVQMQEELTLESIGEAILDALEPLGEIDGSPIYQTEFEAILAAQAMGCKGYHAHEWDGRRVFMPCRTHSEAKNPST